MVVERDGDRGASDRSGGLAAQVVAIHRDVEFADLDFSALDAANGIGQASSQQHATGGNAQQHQVGTAGVDFDDLVGHASNGASDLMAVPHDAGG